MPPLSESQVSGSVSDAPQVYLHDRLKNTNILVSRGLDDKPANSGADQPILSGNGSYLAFLSASSNLVAEPTAPNTTYLYLYDVVSGTISRVPPPVADPISYIELILSKDGARLAFVFGNQIYLYDTSAKTSTLVTQN